MEIESAGKPWLLLYKMTEESKINGIRKTTSLYTIYQNREREKKMNGERENGCVCNNMFCCVCVCGFLSKVKNIRDIATLKNHG